MRCRLPARERRCWPSWLRRMREMIFRFPCRPGPEPPQTAKELPQPQVWLALGLVKLKPPPIRAEEKSSCMP